MRSLALLAFVATTIVPGVAAAATFRVTNTGMTAWHINGQDNPALTLHTGTTYTFDVNAPPNHPFFIKTAPVTGSGSTFDTGVTGNGMITGTVTFTVPAGAPTNLFYQCGNHQLMSGAITIAPAVPATGPIGVALLGLTLCAAGFITYRRLARTAA